VQSSKTAEQQSQQVLLWFAKKKKKTIRWLLARNGATLQGESKSRYAAINQEPVASMQTHVC